MTPWQCWRLRASLVDFANGALAAKEQVRVGQHLAGCARCAASLAALREVVPLVAELPAVKRDEADWRRQRANIMRAVAREKDRRALPAADHFWRPALSVAAVVLVAVAMHRFFQRPLVSPTGLATASRVSADGGGTEILDLAQVLIPQTELSMPEALFNDLGAAVAAYARWIGVEPLAEPPHLQDLNDDELETLQELVVDMTG